mgnify:FL=1
MGDLWRMMTNVRKPVAALNVAEIPDSIGVTHTSLCIRVARRRNKKPHEKSWGFVFEVDGRLGCYFPMIALRSEPLYDSTPLSARATIDRLTS